MHQIGISAVHSMVTAATEQADVLEQIRGFATTHEPDVIVIAGDVYDLRVQVLLHNNFAINTSSNSDE